MMSLGFTAPLFFIGRTVVGNVSFTYAVTAAHVIEAIKNTGLDEVYIRLNAQSGSAEFLQSKINHWHMHPDPSIDVAVLPIHTRILQDKDLELLLLPISNIRTRAQLETEDIGIGTEVFLTGLFRNHTGTDRNEPIIRVGNLAAIPKDPIKSGRGNAQAYLIEARSIGGLSGSPVFAQLGNIRVHNGQIQTAQQPMIFLIGLMHGHFDTAVASMDIVEDAFGGGKLHTGVGIVVPADYILETVYQPNIKKIEEPLIAQIKSDLGVA